MLMSKRIAVKECMVDHKDWRICQPHVQAFKECIEASKKAKVKSDS